MTIDRCRPLKIETPTEGGTQSDQVVVEVDPSADYLDANGLTLQATSSNRNTQDSLVYVNRGAGNQGQLNDAVVGTLLWQQLVTTNRASPGSHASLRDIVHFIDGPADGFASGMIYARNGTAPNASGYTWYASNGTTIILKCVITYPTGSILPSTKVYTLYAVDGATVVVTITDTLTWTGPLLTQQIRTWTRPNG
jgi:hypothetical protein